MKINSKIKLSFVVYTIVPILLILVSLWIIMFAQKKSLENYYGIKINGYSEVFNTTILLNKISESAIEDVRTVIVQDVTLLEDKEFLKSVNHKLEKKYSYIITIKNETLYFASDDNIYYNFSGMLPSYEEIGSGKMKNFYASSGEQYLIKAEKFNYMDESEGVVYIISRTGVQMKDVSIITMEIIIIAILIFLLTGMILTLWLHKAVMRPLNNLKRATEKIATGNLDFTVKKLDNDEFGELSESFEIMRGKLKETIEANLLYDKESKELISNISHDLKTPITTIKGYVEGLLDGVADTPEKQTKYLKTVYNKSVDMDRLIGELTLYSQIDTNRIPYNFIKLNIGSYMKDFYEETEIEFEQRNMIITMENELKDGEKVMADPEQLRRVINNIVGNSVKYIDKTPGKVDIRISEEGDFVHIAIGDNGKGIEEKDLPLIFDRFYRTDASRNSTQGGSGIGLAIVKKIVEAHGGKIWAESEIGVGTTIHFTLKKAIA